MLGSLLKQLVFGLDEIPEEISKAYRNRKNSIGGQGLQIANILKMLQVTSVRKRAFICIDALDECATEHQVKILDSLGQLLQQSPGTRIFVTGRPHILPEIGRRLGRRVTSMSISSKRDDIVTYLRSRLATDTTPDAMDSTLEADIMEKIPGDISEMYEGTVVLQKLPKLSANRPVSRFLLVSLNIDAILQETTMRRRRQKLRAITDGSGLESAYGESLGRIKRQGGARAGLGMAALMWISHSERPLKVVELCHALAVEIGSPNLNDDDVPSIGTLLACCQGLVAVDKEASTVRLIHFTLQEYLRAHPEVFGTTHATIAETCLSYLNSQQVRALSTSLSLNLQDTPFLEYSSLYWGVHAKKDLSDCAKLLALKLFDNYNNHISVRTLLEHKGYSGAIDFDRVPLFSSLHCASHFGIVEIVTDLIEVKACDINERDCVDNTPLVWAALNGHERVVEILLNQGDADSDKPGLHGKTPLLSAAYNGHEGVVRIFLEQDEVNPDKRDILGRTPLVCAAWNGHKEVVEMLLQRGGVNPDKQANNGRTPLLCAAWNGHVEVVRTLLKEGDVNSDKPDNDGRTPLRCAAWNGHVEVVRTLLERDEVNPDKPDNNGRTPLMFAAGNGYIEVVKILLELDEVNPGKPDNNGRTPLMFAAGNGYVEMVKILLERREVNPDEPDNGGETPLRCAAWNGHVEVVKTLLARGDVYPDKPDNKGRTPLRCAAWNWQVEVVKMLLARGDVNPDAPDLDGRTPLRCAAWNGHVEMVRTLLERREVNPDAPDNKGRTPLWCAAWDGHVEVVKVLLARGDVNPNKPDNNGRTPLLCAASNGHVEVVEMLLARGDVNPDKPDNGGRTPLSYATGNGYAGVAEILLARGDVNPNMPDKYGQTPLRLAIRHGHTAVVVLLQPGGP